MLTEYDKKQLNGIIEFLQPLIPQELEKVDWEKEYWVTLLQRIIDLSPQIKHWYKRASKADLKQHYFTALCSSCGWFASSKYLIGGGQIGDTGDYEDCRCPICNSLDIDEK